MNNFTRRELEEDDSGLLECCDFCNNLIFNWNTLENSFVKFDGRIACKNCSPWNKIAIFGTKSEVLTHIKANFSSGAVGDWTDFNSKIHSDSISVEIYEKWLNQYLGIISKNCST